MGAYRTYLFPYCLDLVMSRPVMQAQRPRVLARVEAPVLEIGFGTGLNLPFYPSAIRELHVIEPNLGMKPLLRRRLRQSPIQVKTAPLRHGRILLYPDEFFQSVVCTWTLCSIAQVDFALEEIYRVLRRGGRFHFVEHGLAPDPEVARWQQRLNRLQMLVADGCHLNRNPVALVSRQPFVWEEDERCYAPQEPRFVGYTYRGVVRKD
jgi:ubiquinone/menaquinone biosynthesis C-methylase UbiE